MVALRLILEEVLKEKFKSISSLMKSRAVLDSWQYNKKAGEALHVPYIWNTLPILCIAGLENI